MFESDKGLQATIQRMLADINALKGRGIIDIIEGDNISIDKKNPRKPKISSTASGGGTQYGGNIVKTITPADFSGSDYIDSDLIGKIPDTGFMLFSDGGSGSLLHNGDGYTFDDTTGTITTDSGDYRLIIIT